MTRVAEQRRALRDLLSLYESLRGRYAPDVAPADRLPTAADVAAVRARAGAAQLFAESFDMVIADGDIERAAVTVTRRLIPRAGGTNRARSFAQVLHRDPATRPVAEICLALCAVAEPMPEQAWALFTRNDPDLVVRWAAEEYFRTGFDRDPRVAAAVLARVLDGRIALDADPHVWLGIAYAAFAAGSVELAGQVLDRAAGAVATVADPSRVARLDARLSSLRSWVERAGRAEAPIECPAGEIPFGLVGFDHPDRNAHSRDLNDPVETLAALGHLLRRRDVRFTGEPALVAAAERLRADVPADLLVSGEPATVRLYEIPRDASGYSAVPDGTWVIVSEWFVQPLAGTRYDMPLDARLRPIFVSFHITPKELRSSGAVEYLRAHAPIGCRDWDTVWLLRAAGVPAFHSGALTATLGTVVPPRQAPPAGRLFLDVAPDGAGEQRSRLSAAIRERDLGDNLVAAAAELRGFRDSGAEIVTADPRLAPALRAVGCRVDFRIEDAGDYRALTAAGESDEALAAAGQSISDKLAAVLGAVLADRPADEVYEAWRSACAGDVADAEAVAKGFAEVPEPGFDLSAACAAIREVTVTIERSEPGPVGAEINVEFSVDGNYKHQLDIVLDSVVQRSSRPIRAFVLCRDYGPDDFDRMARLFPTVSFVWLQTGGVDYGNVRGMIKWVTVVTMDRTILPELLPGVDRIIHVDLDALCLADLAELFDTDLGGACIAAADEPQVNYGRGFDSLRDSARLLRREGQPDLAREYLIRTHGELTFDFEIFNAGIMVLDLAALRARRFCERFLAYAGRFGLNDQRLLNVGVGRARIKLDPDWNRLVRLEVADSPKIAHWAGPFKPWQAQPYVAGRELWRAQEEHFAARTAGAPEAGSGATAPGGG